MAIFQNGSGYYLNHNMVLYFTHFRDNGPITEQKNVHEHYSGDIFFSLYSGKGFMR